MSRIVYVNGDYVAEEEAKISVFDRGFLFADGVYEVSSVLDGKLIDNDAHTARLQRSLSELSMTSPVPLEAVTGIQENLIKKNNITEGIVYLQITRGAADRDFAFPKDTTPTLIMFTQEKNLLNNPKVETGISVITVDDIRWARRDIKSVGLLAPALAKQAATDAGVDDAWMLEDGFVTEGSSNNAYIITADGRLITRHLSNEILHGITRKAVLQIAESLQITVEERAFTLKEALDANEAFITSASTFVMPVVEIDGNKIDDGKPGPVTRRLREAYLEIARSD